MPNVNVTEYIQNDSGHPEWNDGTIKIGWDTASACANLFKIQACPTTVVIDSDGIITDLFDGSLKQTELVSAIDKALN